MDITLRKNERCIIGLPYCGYTFSAEKSCFIAYPFDGSCSFLVDLLKELLLKRYIQPVTAEEVENTGQMVFCNKICSRIITSQFCIVILDNDKTGYPNSNVYTEYGMMLGFNKKIIPFQKSEEKLQFNTQGLETIKYRDSSDFKEKAIKAIDEAVKLTQQSISESQNIDQKVQIFLLSKNIVFTPIDGGDEKNLYDIGMYCDFYLFYDFAGMNYCYLGVFKHLNPKQILWKINKLNEIISERIKSIKTRLDLGLITTHQLPILELLMKNLRIKVIVNTENDKMILRKILSHSGQIPCDIYSMSEIEDEVSKLESLDSN